MERKVIYFEKPGRDNASGFLGLRVLEILARLMA